MTRAEYAAWWEAYEVAGAEQTAQDADRHLRNTERDQDEQHDALPGASGPRDGVRNDL